MVGAIADSSVIISLAGIGRLGLLVELHRPVVVTPAVYREVVVDGEGQPGAAELAQAVDRGTIEVVAPGRTELVTLLRHDLGAGESESIALAAELGDRVLLLDDRDARARARSLGLRQSGVLGVLSRAHGAGLVTSLREELRRLTTETFFRIDEATAARLLAEAGE